MDARAWRMFFIDMGQGHPARFIWVGWKHNQLIVELIGLIFVYIQVLFLGLIHPIHVSVTSMEYQDTDQEFKVAFRIFYDDFESIIGIKYGVQLRLGTPYEMQDGPVYYTRYISEKFIFEADGQMLKPEFQYKEIIDFSIWLYYKYQCPEDIQRMVIKNELMMDMFDDQTNLMIIKYRDFEKGYTLRKGKENIDIHLGND